MFFLIRSVSVVMSPFSFLIVLMWIMSLCTVGSLAKCLSILMIFSENQILVWWFFYRSYSFYFTKSQGSDGLGAHFYHTFKEDLLLKLSMLFHKIEPERTLHNTFYEATGTLIPKLQKGVTSKQIYWPISIRNIYAKLCNGIPTNQIQ